MNSMRKEVAVEKLWNNMYMITSLRIGDNDGNFGFEDLDDIEVLYTMCFKANGRKVNVSWAKSVIGLFNILDPNHWIIMNGLEEAGDENYEFLLKEYNRINRMIKKLDKIVNEELVAA